MRKTITALALFAVLPFTFACGEEEPPPAPTVLTIGGTLRSAADNQPAANVVVHAVSPTIWLTAGSSGRQAASTATQIQQAAVATATTDASGNFTFTDIDLNDFFLYVVLVYGDTDLGNSTWVNTSQGVVDVAEAKAFLAADNTAELAGYQAIKGTVIPKVLVDAVAANPSAGMTSAEILAQGFVLGTVTDAAGAPVDGATVAVAELDVAGENAIGSTALTKVFYRDGAATFNGTATAAALGGVFVVLDVVALDGLSVPELVALQGTTLSAGETGPATTVADVAFLTTLEWVAPAR